MVRSALLRCEAGGGALWAASSDLVAWSYRAISIGPISVAGLRQDEPHVVGQDDDLHPVT